MILLTFEPIFLVSGEGKQLPRTWRQCGSAVLASHQPWSLRHRIWRQDHPHLGRPDHQMHGHSQHKRWSSKPYLSHFLLSQDLFICGIYLLGENINICWSPDGQTIAVGNKDDVVTFIDAKTHRPRAEEQFKFEVNEISWNNDNDMFFLTNGNGCINILRYVYVQLWWAAGVRSRTFGWFYNGESNVMFLSLFQLPWAQAHTVH